MRLLKIRQIQLKRELTDTGPGMLCTFNEIDNKKMLCILFFFFSVTGFSQSDDKRKMLLIDSLCKSNIDTIVTTYSVRSYMATFSVISKRKLQWWKIKELTCSPHDFYCIFWMNKGLMYYKAFNYCYELPAQKLANDEWFNYFMKNEETLNTIHSQGLEVTINSKKIHVNQNCDSIEGPNSRIIFGGHGDSFVIDVQMTNKNYHSGSIDSFVFCNQRTRDLTEVKILKPFYFQLKKIEQQIKEEVKYGGTQRIENWKVKKLTIREYKRRYGHLFHLSFSMTSAEPVVADAA
ncbi:MAG TPA: hypothetical protein VLB84_00795 [Bacteroidia bacterium]|nr:hypothetical protein [Bacteroidia bacterium]